MNEQRGLIGKPKKNPKPSNQMRRDVPVQIKVTIYPNQLQWIDFISETLNRTRGQTLLECFACYTHEFMRGLKKDTRDRILEGFRKELREDDGE